MERWFLILLCLVSCAKKGAEGTLLLAVQEIGAASARAERSDALCDLAENHLDYMISAGEISHDGFESRQVGSKSGEIVASNCGRTTQEQAASQCAVSWEESPGHNRLMHQSWDKACYALRQSGDCTYCIGLFSND